MQDLNYAMSALDQRASGTITIVDYTLLTGKTFTVGATTLTEGVDFTAVTSNAATATALAAAIDAISGVNAAAVGPVVTVRADAPGTAGNSTALSTNAAAGEATVSAATLLGGVAQTYSDTFDLGQAEADAVEATLYLSAITGSGNVTVTPQFSYDKSVWFDDAYSAFKVLTAAGNTTKLIRFTGIYLRFKIVTSGTISAVTGAIYAKAVVNSKAAFFPTGFEVVKNGELQGSASALQMPDIACAMVKFKARNDNAGNVYIGGAGVTLPNGSTDVTTGFELDAGEETGWLLVPNLSSFYRICDNAGDDLTYIALI